MHDYTLTDRSCKYSQASIRLPVWMLSVRPCNCLASSMPRLGIPSSDWKYNEILIKWQLKCVLLHTCKLFYKDMERKRETYDGIISISSNTRKHSYNTKFYLTCCFMWICKVSNSSYLCHIICHMLVYCTFISIGNIHKLTETKRSQPLCSFKYNW